LKICGIASGFAFGYDPTGRSVFSVKYDRSTQRLSTGRIAQMFNLAKLKIEAKLAIILGH
jgi:hypothetical protein